MRYNRGHTLIEMVISISVISIIMLGMGSALLVATKAMPDANNPAHATLATGEAAAELASELQYAISVNSRSATMIEFTVADRNDDEVDETIRYEWSNTPGDPLTRKYNGGAVVNLLEDVHQFDLSYDLQTISTEVPQGNESAETLLIAYDSTTDLYDYRIADNEWYAEHFLPSLPADTLSWKVTRVQFKAMAAGAVEGETWVQLQLPSAGNAPSGIVLEQKTLMESTLLETYLTQEFSFSNVSGLSPDQGLCLTFRWKAIGDSCKLHGQDKNVLTSGMQLLKSGNQGASWEILSQESLIYSIYGTVTTVGDPQIENTYYLKTVGITLRSGNDNQSTINTTTKTLNKPEVTQ
ncbi:prepilin-type N-terminal cleavage/methylation domain-containing protein [Planctomycetota bacterium]